MVYVVVEITRFVDEHQPGFVECQLVDAYGKVHTFLEKGPVVSDRNLWNDSQYPCVGSIACEVVQEFQDPDGRLLASINTGRPFGIESSSGETKFVVLPSQLVS